MGLYRVPRAGAKVSKMCAGVHARSTARCGLSSRMTPNRKLFMTAAVRHSRPQVLSVFALDTYFVDVNESNKGFVHSGLVVLDSKEYA